MLPLIILLSVFSTFPSITATSYDYAITIDAGSSGTRFYIYQWEHRHASGSIPPFSLPITQSGWSYPIHPGISSLISNPTLAATEAYFTPFLSYARDLMINISSTTRLEDVPITLKATAGMRIIPNITLRDSIMENIRTVFSNKAICPFSFNRATGARIISGEEEAIFGWLTVNHLMKTLIPPVGQPARTWGAMDLGGASTQITFDPSTELLANSFALDIPTHPYLLYAHSHLYFGIDQVVNRSITRVLDDRVGDVAYHPCYPLGYNTTIVTLTGNVTMYGLSNTTACRNNIYELLSKSSPCFSSPSPDACSFAGVYQPSIPRDMNFIAFSSFGYIAKDTGLGEHGTMEQLSQKIPSICSLNYTSLNATFPKKPEFMERLCLHLTYVFTLLHDGYGFPLTNDTRIWFTKNINNTAVEWPLGATLYEINSMSYDLDTYCSSNDDVWTRWIPLIVACILLGFISIGMIRHCYRRHIHATHDDWKTTRDTRQHEHNHATDEIDVEQPLAYSRVNDRRTT